MHSFHQLPYTIYVAHESVLLLGSRLNDSFLHTPSLSQYCKAAIPLCGEGMHYFFRPGRSRGTGGAGGSTCGAVLIGADEACGLCAASSAKRFLAISRWPRTTGNVADAHCCIGAS